MAIKGDPFRRTPSQLSDDQKLAMDTIKQGYEDLWVAVEHLAKNFPRSINPTQSRDIALAKTQLQDSCMWAIRAITKMPGQE